MACTSLKLWNEVVQLEECLSSTLNNMHHISHIIFRYLALPVYPDERLRVYRLVRKFWSLKKWDSISVLSNGNVLDLEHTSTLQVLMAEDFRVSKHKRSLGSVLEYLEVFIPNMRTLEISQYKNLSYFEPYLSLLKDSYLTSLRLDGCLGNSIIPISIVSIQSLRHLCLKACEIFQIPTALHNLKNLQTLDISKNKIENLDNLKGMTSLTSLDVSYNNCLLFIYEGLEIFDHLPSLQIFKGHQYFQHYYSHGLRSKRPHKNLREADFRGGLINSFSPNILHTFPNLQKLTMNLRYGSVLLACHPNHPLKELVYHDMDALPSNVVLSSLQRIALKNFR